MSTATERLTETVAKLGAQLDHYIVILEKLEEIVSGTAKTGGLKERIAIAEEEIKRNKESFEKINTNITNLRNEMLIEVGKIAASVNANAQQKASFWRDLGQSVVKAIAVLIATGTTGILFWKLVQLLAANAPLP